MRCAICGADKSGHWDSPALDHDFSEIKEGRCDSCGNKSSIMYIHPELPIKIGGNIEISAMLCYNCNIQAKNNKEFRTEWLLKNVGL